MSALSLLFVDREALLNYRVFSVPPGPWVSALCIHLVFVVVVVDSIVVKVVVVR